MYINNIKFTSKAKVLSYIKNLLLNYKPGDYLSINDLNFVIDLAQKTRGFEKIGIGIERIQVVCPSGRGKTFLIEQKDGTKVDFSTRRSLHKPNARLNFSNACREAICKDIAQFAAAGELKPGQEVDHVKPFWAIVEKFIAEFKIDVNRVEYQNVAFSKPIFKDNLLRQKWINYHRKHSELQIMDANLNRQKSGTLVDFSNTKKREMAKYAKTQAGFLVLCLKLVREDLENKKITLPEPEITSMALRVFEETNRKFDSIA